MYPPPRFEDYVSWIQKRSVDERVHQIDIPVLPTSLQFESPMHLPNPSKMHVYLKTLDATKICFSFVSRGDPPTYNADAVAKLELQHRQEQHFAIRALSSLAAEKGKTLWPVPPDATRLDESSVFSDEVKDVHDYDGTQERTRVIGYKLCGPIKITDETKFLVITSHFGRSGKPDYKDPTTYDDPRKTEVDRENQDERMAEDGMILIAITDGAPNLGR